MQCLDEKSSDGPQAYSKIIAYTILSLVFGTTLLIAKLRRPQQRSRRRSISRMAVTGTFYSRNWFLSHARPLAKSGVGEVIVVANQDLPAQSGIRNVRPPAWAAACLGRAVSKLIWMLIVGARYRPDFYMGYHIFPGAMTALIVARIFGRPACYQMTGGPIEIAGGGFGAENRLMRSLKKPSVFLERMAVAVARQFDLVVVRGSKARDFLKSRGVTCPIEVIPGSVTITSTRENKRGCYDLIFVGRLTELKQPLRFVEVMAAVRKSIPTVRAAIVGSGPLLAETKELATELCVSDCLEILGSRDDVAELLVRSKVFVLTSTSEGMSIAMLEAMAAGLPVVVAEVGELSDLVVNGQTGWLITPHAIGEYAARIVSILGDKELYNRLSRQAREAARSFASVDVVAERWRRAMDLMLPDSGSARPCGEQSYAPAQNNRV